MVAIFNSFSARFDSSGFNTSGFHMDSLTTDQYKVLWGDGTQDVVNGVDDGMGFIVATIAHTYASGDYQVRINDLPNDPNTPIAKFMVYAHSDTVTDLTITTGGLSDMVLAGAGNDVIKTGAGNDWISGGPDCDDTINGGAGNDVIFGDTGNDHLVGGDGGDFIGDGTGDDVVLGGAGFDTLNGDEGNDLLRGGDDQDVLHGGDNDDKLYGDAGDDIITGDAGNDKLFGGDGQDMLDGGTGQNQLTGGADADYFFFAPPISATLAAAAAVAPNKTTIMDFSSINTGGDGDRIDLMGYAFFLGPPLATTSAIGPVFPSLSLSAPITSTVVLARFAISTPWVAIPWCSST
jgi:Ca2+-binding RTX toxin-like protein